MNVSKFFWEMQFFELVTSNYLYRTYQKESEGKLSKIRASLVCEPTLAGCARDINLGKYVLLSKGEDMTGGRSRDSILSDAFEAVIGAIYLDQGIETATKFIETYLFKDVENKVLFFDAKTNLQEIVQGEGKGRLKICACWRRRSRSRQNLYGRSTSWRECDRNRIRT